MNDRQKKVRPWQQVAGKNFLVSLYRLDCMVSSGMVVKDVTIL